MSKGKIAYVTGGMGGIGTSLCQRLHQDGFKVIAGCGPSRDFVKWLDEQKALGYEFHASVVLAWQRETGADLDKVNVNGGAIAIGHPLGASGARLVLTLLLDLRRRGKKYGVASACIGGGQGIAMVVEAL